MPTPLRPRLSAIRLADVAALVGADAGPNSEVPVTGITLDSRSVLPGDLYAALPGHLTHGARFAASAVSSGAVAVLTDATGRQQLTSLGVPVLVVRSPRAVLGSVAALVYDHPGRDLQILGVTGTNGKTTVAAMVESGLRAGGRVTGMIGTVGVTIAGDAHAGMRTTPEATELQAVLAVMRERSVDSVVMEVSSIALDEHRVDGVVYEIAAFTNLSQDHLDYHGTMEDYFAAKMRLFTAERSRLGIVGVDDDWGRLLAERTELAVDTWSIVDPGATWSVRRSGPRVQVFGPDSEGDDLRVPMPGDFNVANALCAFGMLRRAGISAIDAARGIEEASIPGRMQVVRGSRDVMGIVDYAHSPDAIERVLRAARESTTGRVIAVLGAGGDRDRTKRPIMGLTAAQLADAIVITDDNPRSEDPAAIRAAVREGARSAPATARAEIHEVADRRAAITVAVDMAEAGDVVLVLGKGHEQGQDVGGVVSPFDDVTELRRALGLSEGSSGGAS
jgi:UDP-N-acetylmuramoyl-L-alanyl-D-glutamate--2,6-diaminopimelate ligase